MGLPEAIAAIADVLGALSGIDAVEEAPPNELTESQTFVLHEEIGGSAPAANRGRNGGVVYQVSDVVHADYFRLIGPDDGPSVATETRQMRDAAIDALWAAYSPGRFGGTVLSMTRIDGRGPIPRELGAALTFSFRLSLAITTQREAGT